MSFRTVIDSVLLRLREDTIGVDWSGVLSSTLDADDYQKLIGELVNETKIVVEDAWQWGVLRKLETVPTVASTGTYDMPNLDTRSRILQVIDDTNDNELTQISDAHFYHYTYIGSSQVGQPTYYRLNGNDISFWPTPDAAYNIRVHAVQPQDNRTLAADTITVSEHLVILGAYALALNERGEDGGTLLETSGQRFNNSLTDAIVQDEIRTVNETNWYAS